MKGGYHPQARLATHVDEMLMEALIGLESEIPAVKDRAFREIARLARRTAALLQGVTGSSAGPRMATAGA